MVLIVTTNSQSFLIGNDGDTLYKITSQQFDRANIRIEQYFFYKNLSDSLNKEIFQLKSISDDYKQSFRGCMEMRVDQEKQLTKAKSIINKNEEIISLKDKEIRKHKFRKTVYLILFAITGVVAIAK